MEALLGWYVCLWELQTVCVPAHGCSLGFVSMVYVKGENSAIGTGPTAGKSLADTPRGQFKKNMVKGFLIVLSEFCLWCQSLDPPFMCLSPSSSSK